MDQDSTCAVCIPNQDPVEAPPTVVENVLDPSTFIPPTLLPGPSVTIEFCDRCKWLHRSTWTLTELALTFPPPLIQSITLVPRVSPETAGRFRVWLVSPTSANAKPVLVWDRKVEGGFPEMKVLKSRIRDHIAPGKSLGHSEASVAAPAATS